MNSRERILAAIDHQEPDGVPVDLGATPSSGISAIAYDRLIKRLRLGDTAQPRLRRGAAGRAARGSRSWTASASTSSTSAAPSTPLRGDWYDFTLPDGTPVEFPAWFQPVRQPDGSWDALRRDGTRIATHAAGRQLLRSDLSAPTSTATRPTIGDLAQADGPRAVAGLAHSPWDHAGEPDFWAQLRRARARICARRSDRALMIVVRLQPVRVGHLPAPHRQLPDGPRRPDPAEVERLLDALMERHLATLEERLRSGRRRGRHPALRRRSGHRQRAVHVARDLPARCSSRGTRSSATTSTQHSQMHTFLHSCGSIYKLMPDLIEAGFDVINPVQITSRDMEPERLKREFGEDITFWGGGCDTRHILNQRHARTGEGPRAPQYRDPRAGRRLRLQHRPQHPARRAAREHRGHVRGGRRVPLSTGRFCRLEAAPIQHRRRFLLAPAINYNMFI